MSRSPAEETFDLAGFVLGYFEHAGALVTPPAWGVYEVLLPDDLAARLGVDSYLRLSFGADGETDALRLSVNHPLVEAIAEETLQEAGHALVFINHVRLDKRGLFEQANRGFSFANARLSPAPANEGIALHHYLRCNFKATLLTDEKQEQMVTVVMDVQGGYAVRDPTLLERLRAFETKPAFPHLPVAPPRWHTNPDPFAPPVLQALLERAQKAAVAALTDRLAGLQTRLQRLLELDHARIEDYYAALEHDLRQRMARLDPQEDERRRTLEAKIAMLQTERAAKLDDARQRYQLRVAMELVNTLVIVQPKVVLPVHIGNRRVTVTRTVVWDPLMHRLEPLPCDVCGEPDTGFHLCTNGHLAHRDCLAPQCVECNRVYCRLCADQVLNCVVCSRPVCRASARTCPECGRVTCSEHPGLCHAAEGQPLLQPTAVAPSPPLAPPPPTSSPPPSPERPRPGTKTKPPARTAPAKPARPQSVAPQTATPLAVRLNVQIEANPPRIVAFVMRSTNRVLATRVFELTSDGILISCQCEKKPCPASGWIYRPQLPEHIAEQIKKFLADLRQEYLLPSKRTYYFLVQGDVTTRIPELRLPPTWTDPVRLAQARANFDRRRG